MDEKNLHAYLQDLVDSVNPDSLLSYGDLAKAFSEEFAGLDLDSKIRFKQLPQPDLNLLKNEPQYQLALIADELLCKKVSDLSSFIGQIRNQYARQIILIFSPDTNWNMQNLIALGFKREGVFEFGNLISYSYDIRSYNKKRKWNNPKNWANPEMWNKSRW